MLVRSPGLEPGWHDVTIAAEGAEPVRGSVQVIGTDVAFGLVSDIDDTVMVTALPRPFIAAWNTFVRHEQARHIVPGMAPLYRTLLQECPGSPIFYLSTGAWNTAPTLTRFLKRHGYPAGPLLLTDWGPTNTGMVPQRPGAQADSAAPLAREFPQIRWVLVGDDGQHDPRIYGDFARDRPEAVEAIAIRQLTPAEQVLSHGIPVSNEEFAPRYAGRSRSAAPPTATASCTSCVPPAPPDLFPRSCLRRLVRRGFQGGKGGATPRSMFVVAEVMRLLRRRARQEATRRDDQVIRPCPWSSCARERWRTR